MIVSHKFKFIFVKTAKTAGTSIEIALSKYCGPEDIITPCSAADEALRRNLGYRSPQNFRVPLRQYSLVSLAYAIQNRQRIGYYNHNTAEFILKHVGQKMWNSYFTFCFERNPWDKVVSSYYFDQKIRQSMTLSEYIQRGFCNNIAGFNHYSIGGTIAVKSIFFYEKLEESVQALAGILKLPEVPTLPHAKGNFRPPNTYYRDVLTVSDRDKIAKAYAREIAYFGYTW